MSSPGNTSALIVRRLAVCTPLSSQKFHIPIKNNLASILKLRICSDDQNSGLTVLIRDMIVLPFDSVVLRDLSKGRRVEHSRLVGSGSYSENLSLARC